MNPSSKPGPLRRAAAPALLAAAVLAVHSASIGSGGRLTAHHDNLDGAAPLRVQAARQWMSGRVPLWNPFKRAGMPLLADTTAGALHPGNAPFLFVAGAATDERPDAAADSATDSATNAAVSASPDAATNAARDAAGDDYNAATAVADSPVFVAMDAVAALHAVLGALLLFALLRELGLAPAAAALGGLVFGASGTTSWFAAWYIQIQNSIVLLPLVLLGVHRAATTPGAFASATAMGAAGVALQWLAGYPETSVYSGLVAAAWAACLAAGGRGARAVAALVAVYAAGVGLAAAQLLPALELQALARRPGAVTLEMFQSLPATASLLASLAVPSSAPGLEFPPAAAGHVGLPATLLAVVAVVAAAVTRRRARLTAFVAVLGALAFALSLGAATPLSAWLWHVPGLSAFRHPFKHLFEAVFALSCLAALGAQALLDAAGATRGGTSSGDARHAPGRPGDGRDGGAVGRGAHAAVVVAIVATVASLRVNHAALVTGNPAPGDQSGRPPAVVAALGDGWRVLTQRTFVTPRDPARLVGDYPSWFGVEAVQGAGPFLWSNLATATGTVEEETSLRRGLLSPSDRTLDVLSCAFVLQGRVGQAWLPAMTPAAMPAATPGTGAVAPVFEHGDVRVLRRPSALPKVRAAGTVRCADAAAVDASLQGGGDDPAHVALVACESNAAAPAATADPSGVSLRVTADEPGLLEIATQVPEGPAAFVVVSQAALPGWSAFVDGREATVRVVHGLVQGVEVPAGTATLVLRYAPRSFAAGAAVSALAAALLAAFTLAERRRRAAA